VPQLPIPVGAKRRRRHDAGADRLSSRAIPPQASVGGSWAVLRVQIISNKRDPILKLPDRARRPDLPRDDIDARLPDGGVWTFRFAKEFCNVARLGAPRTSCRTCFVAGSAVGRPAGDSLPRAILRISDGWCVEPIGRSWSCRLGGELCVSVVASGGRRRFGRRFGCRRSEAVALPVWSQQKPLRGQGNGDSMQAEQLRSTMAIG